MGPWSHHTSFWRATGSQCSSNLTINMICCYIGAFACSWLEAASRISWSRVACTPQVPLDRQSKHPRPHGVQRRWCIPASFATNEARKRAGRKTYISRASCVWFMIFVGGPESWCHGIGIEQWDAPPHHKAPPEQWCHWIGFSLSSRSKRTVPKKLPVQLFGGWHVSESKLLEIGCEPICPKIRWEPTFRPIWLDHTYNESHVLPMFVWCPSTKFTRETDDVHVVLVTAAVDWVSMSSGG